MNRKRSKRNLSAGSVVFLVFVAVVLATAGMFHAFIKNQQIEVARRMERTEQRIGQHEMDIKTLQMHLDEELNRYLLRDRLRQSGSPLVPIPVNMLEEIEQFPDTRSPSEDLARRGP